MTTSLGREASGSMATSLARVAGDGAGLKLGQLATLLQALARMRGDARLLYPREWQVRLEHSHMSMLLCVARCRFYRVVGSDKCHGCR